MELEIQKLLRNGTSLQDLIWDYDLQTFESVNYPDLICFDYSILSPKTEKVTQEARGLVLDKKNWDVHCISMNAFHEENSNINYPNSKAYVKYDGCLVILYHYNDEWLMATRFSVDGDCFVASAYSKEKNIKWRELFDRTLYNMKIDLYTFYNSLNEDFCYSFELCTKFNKNVVIYEEDFLKLLAITDKTSNKEITILDNDLLFKFPDLEPEFKNIYSEINISSLFSENPQGYDLEGYVLVDQNFNRVKLRNPNYNSITAFDDNENIEYITRLVLDASVTDVPPP